MEYGLRTQEVRAIQKDCIKDGVLTIRRKFSENRLVETTKTGKKGRTYHGENPINGKIRVYLMTDNFELTGQKMLCDPEGLKKIGFID